MNWLEMLKKEMFEITRAAALEYYPAINGYTEPYYNLRHEHVKQVEREALKLLDVYNDADRDVVLASVWTHDRFKPQFTGHDHANKAADWVAENLESKGFPKEKVNAVEYAVRKHAGWEKGELDTLEARILWDADKISHYGPSGFFQMFFILTSEKICRSSREDVKGAIFEPTISLDNVLPVLSRMKAEIDYNEKNRYHLEESWKISIEKREAVNALLDAIHKQL